ncbi:MAG: GTPase HflX [Bacteroidia bacterium]
MGVSSREIPFAKAKEYIEELVFLTETAGGKALQSIIQRMDKPDGATYIGKGKLEELRLAVEASQADMVIFDDDLSPSQIRNIDKALGGEIKVLDRSSLILHIFSERAQTAQARAQVDLAQYQYLLPRLTGMWTHLSRQRGGIGLKGAGEKEIETDRRIIRQRIAHLKLELEKIDRQDATRRKNRSEYVRVALVGYTNVGKSSLMRLLSKADVLAEDKLFATLDTTVRKVSLSSIPFLLSDTVGFIRKLPPHLIESFKSTLAESQESDILLHVVDASHPFFEAQMENVMETLRNLGIHERSILTVFNKVDRLDEAARAELERSWYSKAHTPAVFVSAAERWNIDTLRTTLTEMLVEKYSSRTSEGINPFLQQYLAYYRDHPPTVEVENAEAL